MGADAATALDDPVREHAARAGLDAAVFNPQAPADQRFKALIFDATGHRVVGRSRRAAAVLLSDDLAGAAVRAGDRARRRPAGAGGLHAVAGQGDRAVAGRDREPDPRRGGRRPGRRRCGSSSRRAPRTSTARSCTSARGARCPVAGRTALVTGASRGIGAAIAEVLEREGASVVRLDLKDADLELDITDADAPARIADALRRTARHRRPQRRRHEGPDAGEDARGPLAVADGGEPARARADHRGAAAEALRGRPDRLRLLDERDRRQRGPDELRDLQGGAARPRQRPRADAAIRRSTRSRPGSSRPR